MKSRISVSVKRREYDSVSEIIEMISGLDSVYNKRIMRDMKWNPTIIFLVYSNRVSDNTIINNAIKEMLELEEDVTVKIEERLL